MRQDSNNSHSTSTNIRFGAYELPEMWWNVNAVEIPSISMSTIKQNTRAGANAAAAPDTCEYTDFNVELTLDKDFRVYDEVYQYFLEGLNVENVKFSHFKKFELWVEFVDGQGKVVKKFNLHSCRLQEFSGLVATPNDPDDALQVLTLSFSILYFTHERPGIKPKPKMRKF